MFRTLVELDENVMICEAGQLYGVNEQVTSWNSFIEQVLDENFALPSVQGFNVQNEEDLKLKNERQSQSGRMNLGPYSQHFIFFVTYECVQ